jgi:protein ImuB
MPLWLALVLPALPLQLAARAAPVPGALAVVDGPAQRPVVACCNDAARAAGIHPGLKLAAAQALAPQLAAVQRRPEREADALHALACWAYQFSAQIVVRDDRGGSGLLLETGASERLFAGRRPLHRHLARGLRELGYRSAFGYAVTPRAAWLVACARAQGLPAVDAWTVEDLHAALAPLPPALLDWDDGTRSALHALGLATLHDLLRLPRAAFAHRFGAARLDDLDRAFGRVPDPQPPFVPPARFSCTIDLPADLADAQQLTFPAHRLLRQLEGFLRGRDAGAAELAFSAHHSARRAVPLPPTRIDLRLAAPERQAARLARLFEERLARIRLPAPAVALALAVERLLPYAPASASLLPPAPGRHGSDWLQLAETLHARFGSERVFQLQALDDHRPEHAWRVLPLALDAGQSPVAAAAARRPLLLVEHPVPLACRGGGPAAAEPAPDYGGPLRLLAGPERIEAGWWDRASPAFGQPGAAVQRDYFVARNPRGQTLWIYRELQAPRHWFLHGFFA